MKTCTQACFKEERSLDTGRVRANGVPRLVSRRSLDTGRVRANGIPRLVSRRSLDTGRVRAYCVLRLVSRRSLDTGRVRADGTANLFLAFLPIAKWALFTMLGVFDVIPGS